MTPNRWALGLGAVGLVALAAALWLLLPLFLHPGPGPAMREGTTQSFRSLCAFTAEDGEGAALPPASQLLQPAASQGDCEALCQGPHPAPGPELSPSRLRLQQWRGRPAWASTSRGAGASVTSS